ncbi:glycosyltransferase family 2 protein [Gillisia limnaea]|uniref:Glycosyl transferase family 2 n=1 Tax=Gillisia limnaea (strain DSM 15749 / LMG 21470 / R-8282) TaxID=865937 RepID=H2BV80_GILLR|nr:glycosyltransferase family A protein [Gillisia limnaea]EHQ01745.1 glycosyl transferase family 2 [Gillisia limnaea DSM 15749]
MKTKLPLISIVIPCFNDPYYIIESVQSAIGQTYINKEIIVVDDGSNLETKKTLASLESRIDLLITQENKGLSCARNEGIERSRGEFILVLDSDDSFDTEFCEKAAEVLLSSEDIKIVTCYAKRFDERGLIDIFKPVGGTIKNFLFFNAAIGNSLYRKKDWKRVKGYDEMMTQGYEDWEFYIRLMAGGGEAYVIKQPLFHYRQKKESMRIDANKIRHDLQKYIYSKHSMLYKDHFNLFIDHLLKRIETEEKEKIKNTKRLEFKIGQFILKPLRYIKSLINK